MHWELRTWAGHKQCHIPAPIPAVWNSPSKICIKISEFSFICFPHWSFLPVSVPEFSQEQGSVNGDSIHEAEPPTEETMKQQRINGEGSLCSQTHHWGSWSHKPMFSSLLFPTLGQLEASPEPIVYPPNRIICMRDFGMEVNGGQGSNLVAGVWTLHVVPYWAAAWTREQNTAQKMRLTEVLRFTP